VIEEAPDPITSWREMETFGEAVGAAIEQKFYMEKV
jgi:hypothetical protein